MSITINHEGQISIVGLTPKEMACLQHGLWMISGYNYDDEAAEFPDFCGQEYEPEWPQELVRNEVTNGDVRVFADTFHDKYDEVVHKVYTLEELSIPEHSKVESSPTTKPI